MAAKSKQVLLNQIWSKTHNDYKGVTDGKRSIMILRNHATIITRLEDLSDEEIKRLVK